MKTRGIIGKRITDVRQERRQGNAGMFWDVTSIGLEDGTRLVLHVRECEADYGVEITAYGPEATAPPEAPPETGLVCSGCGQPSPPPLPGTGGRIECGLTGRWEEIVTAESIAGRLARGDQLGGRPTAAAPDRPQPGTGAARARRARGRPASRPRR